jgi:hypothetical protein
MIVQARKNKASPPEELINLGKETTHFTATQSMTSVSNVWYATCKNCMKELKYKRIYLEILYTYNMWD